MTKVVIGMTNLVPTISKKSNPDEHHVFGILHPRALKRGLKRYTPLGGRAMIAPQVVEVLQSFGAVFRRKADESGWVDVDITVSAKRADEVIATLIQESPLIESKPDRECREELTELELKGQKEPILTPKQFRKVHFSSPRVVVSGSAKEGAIRVVRCHHMTVGNGNWTRLADSKYIRIFGARQTKKSVKCKAKTVSRHFAPLLKV